MVFEPLQGRWLHQFPGQPGPMSDHSLSKEISPNFQSKPPLMQLEATELKVRGDEASPLFLKWAGECKAAQGPGCSFWERGSASRGGAPPPKPPSKVCTPGGAYPLPALPTALWGMERRCRWGSPWGRAGHGQPEQISTSLAAGMQGAFLVLQLSKQFHNSACATGATPRTGCPADCSPEALPPRRPPG